MAHEDQGTTDCSSGGSSHSYFLKQTVAHVSDVGQSAPEIPDARMLNVDGRGESALYSSLSNTEFQDLVLRALLHSTANLVGSSSGLLEFYGENAIGLPPVKIEESAPGGTWKESTFHLAEAKRKRKPEMMRTSAGEDSDSQADFPMPENATSEQRALRTRRLNRWRHQRARNLTSNRKALKKLPYVISVDGTSKPRGIHRQAWKAAIRGQCSRLDPSMDNINHHPKHIVDSIWHALEKEWEFEGFAHKARQMFEKSATKFMRNRKMQLKYKCKKVEGGKKLDDVSSNHWKKIQQLTEQGCNQKTSRGAGNARKMEGKQIEEFDNAVEPDLHMDEELRKTEHIRSTGDKEDAIQKELEEGSSYFGTAKKLGTVSGKSGEITKESVHMLGSEASQEEEVDNQIKNLRRQLEWLETSKKMQEVPLEKFTNVMLNGTHAKRGFRNVSQASHAMKENMPPSLKAGQNSGVFSGVDGKSPDPSAELKVGRREQKCAWPTVKQSEEGKTSLEKLMDFNTFEGMECGDVVNMISEMEGKRVNVGKGVLMGFGGSKFARKIIPRGWCSIKVTSYTASGGFQSCPIPSGWKDHVKEKALREADGCTILWPESLLQS